MKRIIVCVALCLVMPAANAVADEVVWGTSSAEISTDPGFEGYWKYSFDIEWDLTALGPHSMSHVSVYLALCECASSEIYFAFADTTGQGPGEGGSIVYYYSEYLVHGEPTIPMDGPTVKFEPYEDDGPEPDVTGSAQFYFYSMIPPGTPGVFVDYIGIKFSTNTEKGDLVGVVPSCESGFSVLDRSTWGGVKALYR